VSQRRSTLTNRPPVTIKIGTSPWAALRGEAWETTSHCASPQRLETRRNTPLTHRSRSTTKIGTNILELIPWLIQKSQSCS
jgi:hypothetical protein